MAPRDASKLQFDALQIEGGLILPDVVAKVGAGEAWQQTEDSYGVLPGLKLRDEIGRYYLVGHTLWQRFDAARSGEQADAAHKTFAKEFLSKVLGFDLDGPGTPSFGSAFELLSAKDGYVPISIAGVQGLDKAETMSLGAGINVRRSATTALQSELNGSERSLWGLAADGLHLRILRDNASLTRPAQIEFDVDRIFRTDLYSDFTLLWLLAHESRFGAKDGTASECALEVWRNQGREEGMAARGRLRDGVERALYEFGNGFLEHPDNQVLRELLRGNGHPAASVQEFFRQLLRLVYRLIFVMTAEDRDVLFAPDGAEGGKAAYSEGYSLAKLRERSRMRTAWDRHHDAFEGLQVVIRSLAKGEPRLALPALGGLFDAGQTSLLNASKISNKRFFAGLFSLAWLREDTGLVRINWRDMETEEFGSVYESLLELTPALKNGCGQFYFVNGTGDEERSTTGAVSGNQRKTTSSYYTKDVLVEFLLDSALSPVIERVVAANPGNPDALLRINLVDPACGSGHFILGAARRIARRLADLRNPGSASLGEYRHALREAVAHCIYGVDRNELAVELCRVALWIEAVEPGKPLTFLDAKIRHGDSLIGVSDFAQLTAGIPDSAYSVMNDDESPVASFYRLLNRGQRDGTDPSSQSSFAFAASPTELSNAARELDLMPDDSVEQIAAKVEALNELQESDTWRRFRDASDLWTAAFFLPKNGDLPGTTEPGLVPTTDQVWMALRGGEVPHKVLANARAAASQVHAFHWPLMFPDVFAKGGFDVVLGNPPWDAMSPDVKEFFAPYDPNIRFLSPAEQKERVAQLKEAPGVADAWDKYANALYLAARFMKESGRYTLFAEGNLGKGDFNVYRMFVEFALKWTKAGGRASQFVPENLYNGANAAAIRQHLFDRTTLERLVGFENTKRVWFDIDTRAKFCLYVASPGGKTAQFGAVFGINSAAKLAAISNETLFQFPIALVEEFSPDALAISEIAHRADIDVSRKIYGRFQKFGVGWDDDDFRPYARELDMGNDRESFGNDPDGIPVYEGRMVEAFDYRAKAYISGRGRKAVWRDLPFGSDDKEISPQWRLSVSDIPEKIGDRWLRVRAGFCDVASPTNQRAFVAALIPGNSVCGDKVPTVMLEDPDSRALLLWLGVANSFAMDFVARKKVALKMSFTLVDSLPLPKTFSDTAIEAEIAKRVFLLAATGEPFATYRSETAPLFGLPASVAAIEDPTQRAITQAEIDVLVARDLFGLTKNEMNYILDPSDILGADCDFETFGALKRAELKETKTFATKDRILSTWDALQLPASQSSTKAAGVEPPIEFDPAKLPAGAWATPAGADQTDIATAQLAAIMKRVISPTAIPTLRLAGILALEPSHLIALLSPKDRSEWQRLVGPEATAKSGANVMSFVSRMSVPWRNATTQLLGMKCIRQDVSTQTWEQGEGLDKFVTTSWPDGRAWFVMKMLESISEKKLLSALPADERKWMAQRAA